MLALSAITAGPSAERASPGRCSITIDGLITHSAAWIFPALHGYGVGRLAASLAAVSGYHYPPRDYGCEYTGQFADWAISQGITAVDVELTNHADTDFDINLAVLETFVTWKP
jgi:hypothetical protein